MGWSVMVFAAGLGTRMKHLTADRPKPMIEVAGRPLIDHALSITQNLPAARCVVNMHYKPEMLQNHLQGRGVDTVLEAPELLDTGGGLRNALPLLNNSTVMTLNSDAVWRGPNPLKQLAEAWEPDRMDGLLMCIPPAQAKGYQRSGNFVIDADGRVSRGPAAVYSGAQIIKTERLADIPDKIFSLNVLWDMLIAENSLYAVEYDGLWCDVGHPDGVKIAEGMVRSTNV